jgi:hypothetical protein
VQSVRAIRRPRIPSYGNRNKKEEKEKLMLGEQIGEEKGKVSTRRVLSIDGGSKIEVSFEATGKLLGVEHRSIYTYLMSARPDGSLHCEAQGTHVGAGGERATSKAQGIGRLLDGGAVSFRGAQYFYSESPKWKRFNTLAGVFEYEADDEGNSKGKLWEWK